MRRLILLAVFLFLLAACDDGATNPGDYPCDSNIARCANPTPATQPVQIR